MMPPPSVSTISHVKHKLTSCLHNKTAAVTKRGSDILTKLKMHTPTKAIFFIHCLICAQNCRACYLHSVKFSYNTKQKQTKRSILY